MQHRAEVPVTRRPHDAERQPHGRRPVHVEREVPRGLDYGDAPRSAVTARKRTALARNTTRDIGDRWTVALVLLNNAEEAAGRGPVTQPELGRRIAAKMAGGAAPLDKSTVARFANGTREPSREHVEAFCAVCAEVGVAVDPGWMLFGPNTKAPAPDSPLAGVAHLLRGRPR